MPDRPTTTAQSGVYIRALDGLRGVAVLAVIAFHLAPYAEPAGDFGSAIQSVFRFGWTGVDLFFVLSGFLITGILYDNRHRRGRMRAFYGRRLVRIFPLYYAVLVAYVLASMFFASAEEVRALADASPWHAAYLTNIRLATVGEWAAAPLNTTHFWSLAVEEQFYLVWPALLALCVVIARRGARFGWDARRMMMGACVVLVITSIATRVILIPSAPLAAYVLLPARMDALAIGGLVALWTRGPGGLAPALKASGPVLVASAIAILCLVGLTLGPTSYLVPLQQSIGYTLWAVVFAAVLVQVVGHPLASLTGLLWRVPLVETGRISYGLYLIHYPVIFVLIRLGLRELGFLPLVAATLFASYGLSLLSWRYLEAPALRLKRFFPYGEVEPGRELSALVRESVREAA